jgi:hypothetical protein
MQLVQRLVDSSNVAWLGISGATGVELDGNTLGLSNLL